MKWLKQNWMKVLALVVIVGVLVSVAILKNNSSKEYGFVCPSDFKTREAYMDSIAQWVMEYQKDYPDADENDMMKVRDALIAKHGCGSPPPDQSGIDAEKLMEGIKYAESQREDSAADGLIRTTDENELYNNPYIKHIRTAFTGYLAGTNNGVEEGVTEKSELDGGYRCGLDSFDKAYYKSEFTVVKVKKGDYGGVVVYIAFLNKPDTIFWVWVYRYAGGEYTLRGFCENVALIEQ